MFEKLQTAGRQQSEGIVCHWESTVVAAVTAALHPRLAEVQEILELVDLINKPLNPDGG